MRNVLKRKQRRVKSLELKKPECYTPEGEKPCALCKGDIAHGCENCTLWGAFTMDGYYY